METRTLDAMLRRDDTLAVNANKQLVFFDELEPEPAGPDAAQAGPTAGSVFEQESNPGADHTIYLDFDGHTTFGTQWNLDTGAFSGIVSPPYDVDGDPESWGDYELAVIEATWQVVAEDFAPFDVNVTTKEPSPDRLVATPGTSDGAWGVRVVITTDTDFQCNCGGAAYVGSFNADTDVPAFVFNTSLLGVTEAASHEVGHTMRLFHDGVSGASSYYLGHGAGETSWGPIMGASYGRNVTHWSRGEYVGADNVGPGANGGQGPDDLAILSSRINGNGFGYRPDDHGDEVGSATTLTAGTYPGIISETDDVDMFRVYTAGGLTAQVNPNPTKPNLDVRLRLLNSDGAEVAESNDEHILSAALSQPTLAAGTYYLSVSGTGWGAPLTGSPSGWTRYGSLGQYELNVAAGVDSRLAPPSAPYILSAQTDRVSLGWTAHEGGAIDEYIIARSTSAGGPYMDLGSAPRSATSFDDSTVTGDTTYFYVLAVVDAAGTRSEYSDEIMVATPDAPPIVGVVSSCVTVGAPYDPTGFTDVPAGQFYAEAVAWAKANNITTGTSAGTFSPAQVVTRAQMAAFLHRLACNETGSPPSPFADVEPGLFYAKAVDWLSAQNITQGTSAMSFSPGNVVTRAQMATFLWRMAGTPAGSPPASFVDVDRRQFYAPAIDWLAAQNVTNGTSPGKYSPDGEVTRAQMATLLWRLST